MHYIAEAIRKEEEALTRELLEVAPTTIGRVALQGGLEEFRSAVTILLGREVSLDRYSMMQVRRLIVERGRP